VGLENSHRMRLRIVFVYRCYRQHSVPNLVTASEVSHRPVNSFHRCRNRCG
jgi:hypothetical protein